MSDNRIHPSAIVSSNAELGTNVEVGAYAIIEDGVCIAENCSVLAHAQLLSGTRIGEGTTVGRAAILGGEPQSLGFDLRTPTFVEIGKNNLIREHVTIHRATVENAATRVGDENMLMVGCHLGHDAVVGDDNVIGNAALFGGHVELGDHTYVGGAAVFHQFVRIGDYCMIQGNGSFSKDIPHYTTVMLFNQLAGLNSVGLRRAGFTPDERKQIKELYRLLFTNDLNLSQGIMVAESKKWSDRARKLLDFTARPTRRGLCAHD